MRIIANGKEEHIDDGISLEKWLETKSIAINTVVVEYNMAIVEQAKWKDIILKENDTLEVLKFVGGG